jgi:protein-arginine kinase activator protein McsA
MSNICVEIKTVCKTCGNPLPVNALVEKVQCASCQSVASFPYEYWKKSLLESALTEYKELSEGEGQPQTLMTGEYTFNITYGNQKPRCRKCKTTLDVNKYDEFVSAGKAVCEKCKNPVTARLLPEEAKQFFPLVKYLFGEDSDMFSVVPEGKVSAEIEKSAPPMGLAGLRRFLIFKLAHYRA